MMLCCGMQWPLHVVVAPVSLVFVHYFSCQQAPVLNNYGSRGSTLSDMQTGVRNRTNFRLFIRGPLQTNKSGSCLQLLLAHGVIVS
jgi:hypothetical protein